MIPSHIHDLTADMLVDSKYQYKQIAKRLGVSYTWIKDFANDRTNEPSVLKVENLYIMLYKDLHGVKPTHIPLK